MVELTGVAAHSARSWMGHNAIHDAGAVLQRLAAYEPRQVEVDGLHYREGLNAVGDQRRHRRQRDPGPLRDRGQLPVRPGQVRRPTRRPTYARCSPDSPLGSPMSPPGARPGLDQPAAAEFLAAVGGEASAKFGWTDVARFAAMGIPAVNFGPGDPSKAHADDEFCPAEEVLTCRDAPGPLADAERTWA